MSWGSSSMLVCRSQSPIRVQRVSWSEAQIGPVSLLGVAAHAAELDDPERRPPCPTRSCV